MPYLTESKNILAIITQLASAKTLWVDTEVADYKSKNPRVSLILVLADPRDLTGDRTYILDVLDQPDLVSAFIETIMVNPNIEKVFHNAKYDLQFLGKKKAQNITCTWEMAKTIPYYLLPLPNLQLKTLAEQLAHFPNVDKTEQGSDWGKRPLSEKQLNYAKMDTVYLAQVHFRLLELAKKSNPNPATDNLTEIGKRYQEIESEWHKLDSEIKHLQDRAKKAMQVQNCMETNYFKLSSYPRTTTKFSFAELANLVVKQGMNLDFPITLNKTVQKELGETIHQIPTEADTNIIWRLTSKKED
ncbi:MAG: ribonuclease D [Chroococcales cyanobacterium]